MAVCFSADALAPAPDFAEPPPFAALSACLVFWLSSASRNSLAAAASFSSSSLNRASPSSARLPSEASSRSSKETSISSAFSTASATASVFSFLPDLLAMVCYSCFPVYTAGKALLQVCHSIFAESFGWQIEAAGCEFLAKAMPCPCHPRSAGRLTLINQAVPPPSCRKPIYMAHYG